MIACYSQYLLNPDSRVPMVGASGAIAGVMGAYMVKFPHSRIVTVGWFIILYTLELPAWLMLIMWFGMQFFSGVGSIADAHLQRGGTAFFAHIGGFVAAWPSSISSSRATATADARPALVSQAHVLSP